MTVGGRRNGGRVKHTLHVQARRVATTGADGRLLRSIIRAGVALVDDPDPTTPAIAGFPVLAPDGTVVLVEERLGPELQKTLPRIERLGYRVLLASPVPVDVGRAHIRVPDAADRWLLDREAFEEQFPLAPGDDDLHAVDAPITRVVVATSAEPEGAAANVVAATGMILRPDGRLRTGDVVLLARLLARVELAPYVLADPAPLRELVTSRSST